MNEAKDDYERATLHRYTIAPLPGMSASYWKLMTVIGIFAALLYVAAVYLSR